MLTVVVSWRTVGPGPFTVERLTVTLTVPVSWGSGKTKTLACYAVDNDNFKLTFCPRCICVDVIVVQLASQLHLPRQRPDSGHEPMGGGGQGRLGRASARDSIDERHHLLLGFSPV
jgi:hypothetical protein